MNVHQRRDYFMSILMFKCIHGLAPDYLCSEITMQNFKNYFIYRGPVLWNALPVHIKECKTLDMFKTNLRCSMKK